MRHEELLLFLSARIGCYECENRVDECEKIEREEGGRVSTRV